MAFWLCCCARARRPRSLLTDSVSPKEVPSAQSAARKVTSLFWNGQLTC
jgi:hypothetical protein